MSDQEHHDEPGGHELDAMPSRHLFNLVVIFTIITVLACIELIDIFNEQAEEIALDRANKGSFMLAAYRKEMREVAEGYGPTTEAGKFFIPHDKAKELVLKDPSRFRAAEPPEGWVSPDALEGGAPTKGAAPAAQPPAAGADEAEAGAGEPPVAGQPEGNPTAADEAAAKPDGSPRGENAAPAAPQGAAAETTPSAGEAKVPTPVPPAEPGAAKEQG